MRRPLLAVRAGLGVLAAALAATTVAALPAQAAPAATSASVTAPVASVVAGDRTLTAAWKAVTGATSYTVRLSAKRSMAHARTLTTSATSARFAAVKNGTPYYVSVTPTVPVAATPALGAGNVTGGAGSTALRQTVAPRVVRAVAQAGVPFPVGSVTAVPGPGADQLTVTWTGGGRAQKVAVVAGSNVTTNERTFTSGWYPATTRSITITVPEQLRAYLGGSSGNPVWVKVVQSNSTSQAFGFAYDYARKYRPSPVGSWAFAKADVPDAAVTKLQVAELNIQSFGATERYSAKNQWAARLPRVVKYVEAADPDLLTTAELATNVTDGCKNSAKEPYRCASHTQYAEFAAQVDGLQLADTDAYARVMDRMRSGNGSWNGKVTNGAHIFYDPSTLTRLDWGYFAPAVAPSDSWANVTGLGVSGWSGSGLVGPDRWLTWAKFRTTEGRIFFTVAAHFPVGPAAQVVAVRHELAQKVTAAITKLAGSTPVVFGADMNADAVRNPQAGQVVFMQDGWFDAAAVPTKSLRTGMKVSTANGSGAQDAGTDAGYGSRPVSHPYETSRIDYILLKNSPYTYRYANVLQLNPDGTFRRDLQGTDHNMQLATIGIAGPTAEEQQAAAAAAAQAAAGQ